MNYDDLMRIAIENALKGTGNVSPNPLVGAVIVKNDEIVSTGWHRKYGEFHAEIEAIHNAHNVDLEGSTLVVNLEPCSHEGKQPPCVDVIIEKGFAKVIIGMVDPNPLVSGKSIEMMKEAGIEVVTCVLENECRWLNRYFIKHISFGLPYITLKSALTLNGCVSTHKGESKWISGMESLKVTHKMRAEIDAVAIGRGTAMADNPELTVRHVDGRSPMRVLFDTNFSSPLENKMFKDFHRHKTIVVTGGGKNNRHKVDVLRVVGVKILNCDLDDKGTININEAVRLLSENFNISSMLVEGGPKLIATFIEQELFDEFHFFIAPSLIGNGINLVGNSYFTQKLKDSLKLKYRSVARSGDDLHVICTR